MSRASDPRRIVHGAADPGTASTSTTDSGRADDGGAEPRRPPLSRARVIRAAVDVADRSGLSGMSMRTVGRELGVEAMSLYSHVSSKSDLLDALADWIFEHVELPARGAPWRRAMQERASSARRVLAQHPWALGLIESRSSPGRAVLDHHDSVLGNLREGGFSVALAARAFSVIDAYVYGFVLTETNLPFPTESTAEEFADALDLPADAYPHLVELMSELVVGGGYDFADEFDYGLGVILDELERRLDAASESSGRPA